MSSRVHLVLQLSTMALVFSGYLALAAVPDFGTGILLIPVLLFAFMPLGERLDARFTWYSAIFKGLTLLYCAFIPLSWLTLGPLPSVILLTMYIQGNLLIHKKQERAYHFIFLMAFFLLLSATVQTPEPFVGIAMICFLVSAVWALVSLRLYVETTQAATVAPDIMPLSTDVYIPPDEPRSMFDATLVLNVSTVALAAVLLTVAIFLFTPRLEAGLLGRSNEPFAITGLSEEVDLLGGGYVQEDETAVMIVRFPEEPGGVYPYGDMYWRSSSFPRFQRARWSRDSLRDNQEPRIQALAGRRGHHLASGGDSRFELQRQARPGYPLVFQQIYMDPVPQEGVPALDLVLFMEIPEENVHTGIRWAREEDFSIHLASSGSRRLTYTAWSEVGGPSPELLRQDSGDYSEMDPFDYALLTDHDLLPETVAIVEDLIADVDNMYDMAMTLQAWLSGVDFLYTLELPPLPANNAVDAFIMETRRGHCELFASALALMLRSQGVPTRVVNGYRGGEWNDTDRSYIVRQSDAHLWLEVLFPDFGWIKFDPSPSGDLVLTNISQLKRFLSGYALRGKMFWYQEVVGFHRGFNMERLKDVSVAVFGRIWSPQEREQTGARTGSSGIPAALAWLAVLTVLISFTLMLTWHRRNYKGLWGPKWLLSQDQMRAVRLYTRFQRKLTRLGADCRGKTSEELREELLENRWVDPVVAEELLDVYDQVRFGGRSLPHARFVGLNRQVKNLRPLAH